MLKMALFDCVIGENVSVDGGRAFAFFFSSPPRGI